MCDLGTRKGRLWLINDVFVCQADNRSIVLTWGKPQYLEGLGAVAQGL